MHKAYLFIFGLMFFLCGMSSYAANCPDPQNSSLKWGVPPPPWELNPFSSNTPQADDTTRFSRANILVAGYGRGVLCTYKASFGYYSIWWQVLTKIPAPVDYHWIDTLGGFICTEGLDLCSFYVAQ